MGWAEDAADPYFPLDWAPTAMIGHRGASDGDSGRGGDREEYRGTEMMMMMMEGCH